MKEKIKKSLLIIPLLAFLVSATPATTASAACPAAAPTTGNQAGAQAQSAPAPNILFPAWYDGLLCPDGKTIKSPNDLGSTAGVGQSADDTADKLGQWILIIAMNVVKMLLMVVAYVSLGFIIWGGFKYMTSGDNSSGTAGARKTIQNAVIGLVLSIMSVAIVTFITTQATGGGGGGAAAPANGTPTQGTTP